MRMFRWHACALLGVFLKLEGKLGLFLCRHMPSVFKAISPYYAARFFVGDARAAWVSLGGVILCISGSEALYADMGHFSQRAITVPQPLPGMHSPHLQAHCIAQRQQSRLAAGAAPPVLCCAHGYAHPAQLMIDLCAFPLLAHRASHLQAPVSPPCKS